MGRLLRIPGFESEQMDVLRKQYSAVQTEERKKRKHKGPNEAGPSEAEKKAEKKAAAAVALGKLTHHTNEDRVHRALDEWIGLQRRLAAGHILNRTTASKGPDGQPISNLRPYETRFIFCELRPDEMEVQKKLADELLGEDVVATSQRVKVSFPSRSLARYGRRVRPLGVRACPHPLAMCVTVLASGCALGALARLLHGPLHAHLHHFLVHPAQGGVTAP